MTPLLINISSFSILLSGLIGLVRFPRMERSYAPFLYLVWLGCLNEILSFILVKSGKHTILNNNLYALAEPLLISWFFRNQRLFRNVALAYWLMQLSFVLIWLAEIIFMHQLTELSFFFRITYSFLVVLMSISSVNRIVIHEKGNILKNALFIICIGFIIYYTFEVLINSYWWYGLTQSPEFVITITGISIYLNLLINLIFAIAVACIPRRLYIPQLLFPISS